MPMQLPPNLSRTPQSHVDVLEDEDENEDVEATEAPNPYRPGALVRVTWLDYATGREQVRYGTVVEHVAEPRPAVRVSWLPDPTDPIPLDPGVHGDRRRDAPHVGLLESE